MEIVKKNIVSILLGVVAIIAVVASFYPLGGLFDKLKAHVSQSADQFQKAKTIYTASHELPLSDDPTSTDRRPLGVFPMPRITKDAKALKDAMESESSGVYEAAWQANKDECVVRPDVKDPNDKMLLVDKALPSPPSGSSADAEFKKALDPAIDRFRQILDAVAPPTQVELDLVKKDLQATYDAKKVIGADGQVINDQQIQAALNDDLLKLPLRERNKRALNHHMYMDATAIVLPTEITSSPQPPSPQSMYFAQAAIWTQGDICRAIAEVNAGTHDIPHAPVKRLLSLAIPFGPAMFLRSAGESPNGAGGGGNGQELSGAGAPSNAAPRNYYAMSATGRTCNGMYDVVNAIVVIHIDATKIPQLLAALNHNRLITVRNMSVSRVNSDDLLTQGFVYGAAPVAELRLDLEQLQMREWTTKLMPPTVVAFLGADGSKNYLSQAPQPPVPGNAGAGQNMTPSTPMGGGAMGAFGGHGGADPDAVGPAGGRTGH